MDAMGVCVGRPRPALWTCSSRLPGAGVRNGPALAAVGAKVAEIKLHTKDANWDIPESAEARVTSNQRGGELRQHNV